MHIKQNFMKNSYHFNQNTQMKPTKLILHSTGTPQPKNSAYFNYWNDESKKIGVHALIGSEGIWQILPWKTKGGHVGVHPTTKKSMNGYSIGVEMCEPSGHTYKTGSTMDNYNVKNNQEYFTTVYNDTVDLFAYLCDMFNLNPKSDILCHSEVHKLGLGSNHGDVMHWFPKHGKSMDTFRADVEKSMEKDVTRVFKGSNKQDVSWLQTQLNLVIVPKGHKKLTVDGLYGHNTRIAVLIAWMIWGWNKDGSGDGWLAGKSTVEKLKGIK